LTTYVKGKQKADGATIKECAKDLHINVEPPKGSQLSVSFFARLAETFRHPLQKPFPGILLYLGLLILTMSVVGIFLIKSGFVPSLKTAMLPEKPIQQMDMAPDKATSPPKPPVKSLSSADLAAQAPNTTPGPETGTQEGTSTALSPAEPEQKPPPFQEKTFTVQFPPDSNEFSIDAYTLLDDISTSP